jgi:hypothetical protein
MLSLAQFSLFPVIMVYLPGWLIIIFGMYKTSEKIEAAADPASNIMYSHLSAQKI